MKNNVKQVFDESIHDGCAFWGDLDRIELSAFNYTSSTIPEIYEIGYKYHIITYEVNKNNKIFNPELFDAILGDPYHYIVNLIDLGFFGTICKKTDYSSNIVNKILEGLNREVEEQHEDKT